MERLTNTIKKRTLSTKDAAERLGIAQRSVGEAITRGTLKATRYKGGSGPQGFSYRVTASDLNTFQRGRQKRWATVPTKHRKRRVVKKTKRADSTFRPSPISNFETPMLDALHKPKPSSMPVRKAKDKEIERKAKEFDWSKAKTGAFKFTMTEIVRAVVRFKCEKCHKPFIGLIEHRDLVPTQCTTCSPEKGTKWKTTSEWILHPQAGIALAE